MLRRSVIAFAVFAVAGSVAWASPVRLETTGDACNLDGVAARVAQLSAEAPFDASASAVVSIAATHEHGAVVAQIMFDDGDGKPRGPRIVRAKTCTELVEAAAVVVAMALPELAAMSAAATSDATPVVDDVDVDAQKPVAIAAAPEMVVERRTPPPALLSERGETALVLAGAGTATSQGFQEQLIAGLRWRRDARSLTAEVRADSPTDVAVGAMERVRVFRAEASVSPCLHAGELAGCALASVGTIYGSGAGLTNAHGAFTPLLSAGLRATWEHRVSARVALRVHADMSVFATKSEFEVDQMAVWSSRRIEGAAGIGILTRFP